MKHTNPQVEQMTSFIVMDVLERANELQKQGVDMIVILLTIHILWGTRNSGGKLLLFIYGNME